MRIKLEGAKELHAMLIKLDRKVQDEISARAVEDAGVPVLASARRLAPADTGKMRSKIFLEVKKSRSKKKPGHRCIIRTGTRAELGIAQDDASYYPAAVEYGTEERFHKSGKPIGSIDPPRPFMRPAFDSNRQKAINEMLRAYKSGIEKAAK